MGLFSVQMKKQKTKKIRSTRWLGNTYPLHVLLLILVKQGKAKIMNGKSPIQSTYLRKKCHQKCMIPVIFVSKERHRSLYRLYLKLWNNKMGDNHAVYI
jgi:hypothetical protein